MPKGNLHEVKNLREKNKKMLSLVDSDTQGNIHNSVFMCLTNDYHYLLRFAILPEKQSRSEMGNISVILNQSQTQIACVIGDSPMSKTLSDWEKSDQSMDLGIDVNKLTLGTWDIKEPYIDEGIDLLLNLFSKKQVDEIISTIGIGLSNGKKWILVGDKKGNIHCCPHPDDIQNLWDKHKAVA
ncbi:hypothetical protein [Prochlorococcus marinus]|uniref:hypothetical protein n=1 Tax=Prochlorococcus marinus TaxID=1219 RepID=UPI0022B4166B|nr:hypothetical protein [Prochlorococcus marinus]